MVGIGMLSLVGCSQESRSEPKEQPAVNQSSGEKKQTEKAPSPLPLEIVDSGWSAIGDGWVYYGIVIKNPNEGLAAEYPSFTITGKAEDGSIVFSDEQVFEMAYPEETIHLGFQAGNGTEPASVEFKIKEPKWIEKNGLTNEMFTVSNTSEATDKYSSTFFTGEVAVNEEIDTNSMRQIAVTVITRDEDDIINYGNSTFINAPSKGDTASFEISCYQVPEHSSYEVYARVW